MKVFDMHCDTISAIYEKRKSNLHLDIEKMRKGDYGLQTFALFVDKEAQKDSFCTAQEMAVLFQEEIKKNSQDIAQVFTYKYIEEYEKNCKGSLLIITHSTRILESLSVDYTHVMIEGKIISTGDASLVDKINENGFAEYEAE